MFDRQPPAPSALRTRRCAGERLRDGLLDLTDRAAVILTHNETSWASITFAGARHKLVLAFDGPAAVEAGELFIAALPDHEFAIPGQLVAEAAVVEVDHQLNPPFMRVTCEILLLEDA
jgi:hypothetical protein